MSVVDVSDWYPDLLGPDFSALDIRLGPDPEGETDIVATLVRYGTPVPGRTSVLWVHGMTDYFFHAHVAQAVAEAGFNFYALDLRKCGRSRRDGQRWHYSTDFRHYFPELTASLDIIDAPVVPVAHSTGGLIVPLWADHLRRINSERHARLAGIVLNSPWLDMMYPRAAVAAIRPVAGVLGRLLPAVKIPGGNLGTYGVSIHKDHHGDWDFNVTFKPVGGHHKYPAGCGGAARPEAGADQVDVGCRCSRCVPPPRCWAAVTAIPTATTRSSTSSRSSGGPTGRGCHGAPRGTRPPRCSSPAPSRCRRHDHRSTGCGAGRLQALNISAGLKETE